LLTKAEVNFPDKAKYPLVDSDFPTNKSKMGDATRPLNDIRLSLRQALGNDAYVGDLLYKKSENQHI